MAIIKSMKKLLVIVFTFSFLVLTFTQSTYAVAQPKDSPCNPNPPALDTCLVSTQACLADSASTTGGFRCQSNQILVTAPDKGYKTLGNFTTNVLTLSFGLAVLVVLVMLIWGAFEWISSGGDKEAVGKARNRIINALIGIAVLAVAFALARVAGQFLGFDISNISIPTPNPSASGF